MTRIWKYPMTMTELNAVDMPSGAAILSVQAQGPYLCLWALVDEENPLEERRFVTIGTGEPIDHDMTSLQFLGTVQMGKFVWHIFEDESS